MGLLTDLPPLFDDHGVFQDYAPEIFDSLPDDRQQLYLDVRESYAANVQADSDLKAALDHVRACADAVTAAEKAAKRFKSSFHELWRDHVKGPRNER